MPPGHRPAVADADRTATDREQARRRVLPGGRGAEIITGAEVYAIEPGAAVRYRSGADEHVTRSRFVAVLAGR